MYFWTPHWAHAKYDLTMVQLPDITPSVRGRGGQRRLEVRVRLRAGTPLYKAFSADLQTKAPAAFAFL